MTSLFDPKTQKYSDYIQESPIYNYPHHEFDHQEEQVDRDESSFQKDGGQKDAKTQPLCQDLNSFEIQEIQNEEKVEQFLQIQDIQDMQDQVDKPAIKSGLQTQQLTSQISKTKTSKNFPSNFSKHLKKFLEVLLLTMDQNTLTIREKKAIQQLKNFINKDKNKSQKSYGISDIRRLCIFYRQNNKIVYKYLKNNFYMDLLLSGKVENPTDYIDHIDWYLRMVKMPRLMRNNLRKS